MTTFPSSQCRDETKSFHEVMCKVRMVSTLTMGTFRKEFALFENAIAPFICCLTVFFDSLIINSRCHLIIGILSFSDK